MKHLYVYICVCVCGKSKKGKQMGKKIIWVDFCFGFFKTFRNM